MDCMLFTFGKKEFRAWHVLGGVSGVASFTNTDEQLQYILTHLYLVTMFFYNYLSMFFYIL